MLEPFQLPFVQTALIAVLVLSVPAGVLGVWIVLRGLAFYTHAVGTATFPGLVLAGGLGFAAPLGALASAAVLAGGVARLSGRRRTGYDSVTAVALVGCLAAGVILASDVFRSGAQVEALLFGSLLLIDARDIALAAAVAVAAVAGTRLLGARWLAAGFDADAAAALGLRSRAVELALLALVALAAVAALSAVGALLATALLVVPAATVRLWTPRVAAWQRWAVVLTAVEGVGGLWLSVRTNAPPGATIAVLAGGVFVAALAGRALALRARRHAPRAVAVAACLALAGCGAGAGETGAEERVRVVASTTQLGDLARQVGGEAADVHQILQPSTEPHGYEPRPQDVQAAARADVALRSGDGLDPWMADVVAKGGGEARSVDLSRGLPFPAPASGEAPVQRDPHWWHDPRNARAAVERIRDALAAADPARRASFTRNAERYLRRLGRVDRGIARCMAALPRSRRKLVTEHDAFGYFARRYGIEVIGAVVPSRASGAQASAGDLAELARQVRAADAAAVFPERSLDPRLAEAVARETGAVVGPPLYGDTLGPRGSSGDTYLRMLAANADAMVRGFSAGRRGCPGPELR